MTALGTEHFAQLNCLVHHHAVRHIQALAQLKCAQPQHRVFNRIDLIQRAADQRREHGIQLVARRSNAVQKLAKVLQIGLQNIRLKHKLRL